MKSVKAQLSDSVQLQKMISFKDDQTFLLFPIDKNQILVRFENLADKVDDFGISQAEPWKLDVHQFALSLYQDVNPNIKSPDNIKIERMDLQGVHPIKEAYRFKWLAQAPPTSQPPQSAMELQDLDTFTNNLFEVNIYPQQLKTFRITYMPTEKQPTSQKSSITLVSQGLNMTTEKTSK